MKIKKKIPVKIKLKGSDEFYTVNVKLRIPAPKVKIKTKKYNYWGIRGYDFIFHYLVPGAKKIQVRLAKGGNKAINQYLDKCISGRKSNKSSHIRFQNKALRKRGKKLTFRIVAYYGKKAQNKSEVLIKTKRVKLK